MIFKKEDQTADGFVELINSMANYTPPRKTESGHIWPPPVSCRSWYNETTPDAIHYSKDEIREILKVIYQAGAHEGEIVLSNYTNGLPNILWGNVFTKVIALAKNTDHEPIVDSKQTILSGLGDTKFLYKVMEHISNLKAILIDEVHYFYMISPYFLFKKLIKPPGVVIFMNTANKVPEHAGVHRFISDLSSGFLDNRKHDIVHIHDDPKGYGVSYEIVT